MLRNSRRWHDAANRLLDEEARLARFANGGPQTPGQTPDPQPVQPSTPESPATPQTAAATTRTTQTVRDAVAETLNPVNAEQAPSVEAARAALEDLSKKVAMMHALKEGMKDRIEQALASGNSPADAAQWKAMSEDLEEDLSRVAHAKSDLSYIDTLKELQNVQIPPLTIIETLRTKATRERERLVGLNEETDRVDTYLALLAAAEKELRNRVGGIPDVTTPALWGVIPEPQRLQIYERLNETLGINRTLTTIKTTSTDLSRAMGEKPALLAILQDLQKAMVENAAHTPPIEGERKFSLRMLGGMWTEAKQTLGIEFYTPMQLYMAFQELKEAFLDVRKQHDSLQASKIAALAATALSPLPFFGHDFETILTNNQIKKSNDVKNGFLEALKAPSWDPGFDDMFKPGGIMDDNFHDKNRTRAILEFAASKGMLYEFMDESAAKTKMLYGRWSYASLVPSEWTQQQIDSYWGNLPGDNTSGGDKRAEIAKELSKNVDNADEFLRWIDGNIKAHDLWFAKGVIERALDRGKSGNLSARIGVLMMERLRTDPLLRKIMPIGWMDKTGVLSAKTAAFTFGHFNFQRSDIYRWARSGESTMYGAGSLGRAVEEVKRDILAKDPALNPEKHPEGEAREAAQSTLNTLVGRVLATEQIEVGNGSGKGDGGGKIVTIFDRRFDFYNKGSGKQRDDEVDVAKLPDDFFADPSEVLLCDAPIIAKILSYGSTRLFDHDFRAKMLFTHAGRRLSDLRSTVKKVQKTDPAQAATLEMAAERFRTTFGEKLVRYLRAKVYPQTNTLPLTAFNLEDGTPALMSMVRAGFIPLSVLEEGIDTGKKDTIEFVQAILRQLAENQAPEALSMRSSVQHLLSRCSKPKP